MSRHTTDEIIAILRDIEAQQAQGRTIADAVAFRSVTDLARI